MSTPPISGASGAPSSSSAPADDVQTQWEDAVRSTIFQQAGLMILKPNPATDDEEMKPEEEEDYMF